MSAYGFDDEGEREHDCCDKCGRGSCPGSGSQGEEACTDGLDRPCVSCGAQARFPLRWCRPCRDSNLAGSRGK